MKTLYYTIIFEEDSFGEYKTIHLYDIKNNVPKIVAEIPTGIIEFTAIEEIEFWIEINWKNKKGTTYTFEKL